MSINPDEIEQPKEYLVNLINKHCKNRTHKERIIPLYKSNAIVGPGYNSEMIKFIDKFWNPERARKNSESLNRCIKACIKIKW